MINETVILLTPFEDCSSHRLAKYRGHRLIPAAPFDQYLYQPLQKIFSRVIVYDFLKRITEIGVRGINKEIIQLVRLFQPQYAVWASQEYEFQETTFDAIRREGTRVVAWFFDDEVAFNDYSKWWIPYLDYCVTYTAEVVPKYKELGARVIFTVPIMEGVPIERDWSNIEEKYDVSFVGGKGSDREQYTNELKNRNIPVALFGRGWNEKDWEGHIPFEEMIDIFKTSKINLNFSKFGNTNKMQFKGRIFEICLAGGFLLTEYVPDIENYFEVDKEIVCFKNSEEMVNKVIYYLSHDKERRAIAQAGWKRATGEHTSFHVLSRVFGKIEQDIAAREKDSIPLPKKIKMPRQVRKRFSDYYLNWGMAFLLENYKGLWKDAFALTMSYNPLNIRAWYHYIVGFCPSFTRPALIRLYKGMKKLQTGLLCWADTVPYLRDLKRNVARRVYYT